MILDFNLDMVVYNYKNEKKHICGKFVKLKREQLCFIQNLSFSHIVDEDEDVFSWYDNELSVDHDLYCKTATTTDIENSIKDCFEHYGIKYDYVKVELL